MENNPVFRLSIFAVLAALLAFAASELQAQEEVGYLRTRIDPHVAGVFVNGEYYGTAAMFGHRQRMIELKPGNYTVEIVDPRFKTLKANVKIEAGKTATIRRYLEPGPVDTEGPFGELETEGFGNAAVYVDGKYYANTRELQVPGYTALLKVGEHEIKIVPVDGEVVREEKVQINKDETLVIKKGGGMTRRK